MKIMVYPYLMPKVRTDRAMRLKWAKELRAYRQQDLEWRRSEYLRQSAERERLDSIPCDGLASRHIT